MNYVGNVSILDRGDAPAQAIIDRNARSLAQRVSDETKEELTKVLERVDHIYDTFEIGSDLYDNNKANNLEYVNDLAELEDLLKDQVKKKKYMQQVTIFIVGFENVSGQKLRLLQQVNEFFTSNATNIDEEDSMIKSPELDLDNMADTVDDTLKVTEDLAYRLASLNREMMEYMYNYAQAKTSNKGKKKLEKSLNQAKEEVNGLTERLSTLQEDIEEKEEKMTQLFKQVEMKNMEVQRYKTAAEVAKRHVEDVSKLREDLTNRDDKIKELTYAINQLELDKGQAEYKQQQAASKLQNATSESVAQVMDLKEALQTNQRESENAKREIKSSYIQQIKTLQQNHESEINQIKSQHMNEVQQLLDRIDLMKERVENFQAEADLKAVETDRAILAAESAALQAENRADSAEKYRKLAEDAEMEKQMAQQQAYEAAQHALELQSMPSQTPHNYSFARSDTEGLNSEDNSTDVSRKPSRQDSKRDKRKNKSRGNQYKTSDQAIDGSAGQEEVESDGEESKKGSKVANVRTGASRGQLQRGLSALETLPEGTVELAEDIALEDEEAWESLPLEQIPARFTQYRTLSRKRIASLDSEIDSVVTKTARKIQTLKAQFHEHKDKWHAEREVLLSHMDQAQNLQDQAEKETDKALDHLEDYINKQEQLEKEEEQERRELMKEEMELDEMMELNKNQEETLNIEPKQPTTITTEETIESPLQPEEDDNVVIQQTDNDDNKLEFNSRATSARSRSSLREQQRSVVSQMRSSLAGRRSTTPTVKSAKSFRSSILSDAVLDENGDIPFPDDVTEEEREALSMHDVGTSPMSTRMLSSQPRKLSSVRKGIAMADHPIVQEFLHAYRNTLDFKNKLTHVLMDKEMVSAAQVLGDIEPVPFDKDDKIQPQIEEMNNNLLKILEESVALFSSVLSIDRDYNVSSLSASHPVSRDVMSGQDQRVLTAPLSAPQPERTPTVQPSDPTLSPEVRTTDTALREMDEKYQHIQSQLQKESVERDKQLQQNTMVIMEMQKTINNLRQQLEAMEKEQSNVIPESEPVMFTRLDSERNAKIMKRAVNDRRLNPEHYQDALHKMDQYISLPAQRFASIVKKYVHHCKMKEIEANVEKSKSLNDNVFKVLDKMETLQNERAVKWADNMASVSMERMRLAKMLMNTLDSIEQESGIFLIKPMYSYKAVYPSDRFLKKGRSYKSTESSYSYLQTTPKDLSSQQTEMNHASKGFGTENKLTDLPPIEDATALYGTDSNVVVGKSQAVSSENTGTWNMFNSQVGPISTDLNANSSHINTPKLLELDINRMLIGQNQISTNVLMGPLSDDRLVNAAHMNTRSYLTVTRPNGQVIRHGQGRGTTAEARSSVPPTTPMRELETPASSSTAARPQTGSRATSKTGFNHGTLTPTLPPITADRKSQKSYDLPLPPHSPPGSSMRQTPPVVETLSQISQPL